MQNDNFALPDPKFTKLYANKIRDMGSLRTNDIQGAQPKKTTFDKRDLLDRYYQNMKVINYWPQHSYGPQSFPNQGNTVQGTSDRYQVDDPRSTNNQQMYNMQQQQQYPQYSQQGQGSYYGNNDAQKRMTNMRNPLYSDFDYNKYNNPPSPVRIPPRNQYGDSLDNFKNEMDGRNQGGYNNYQQSPQPIPNQQNQNYGNNPHGSNPSSPIKVNPVNQPVQHQLSGNQGGRASVKDDFEKNRDAFFVGTGPEVKLPTTRGRNSKAPVKNIKVFNPLTQAPMLRYQVSSKSPEKTRSPMTVKESVQLKKNTDNFFA